MSASTMDRTDASPPTEGTSARQSIPRGRGVRVGAAVPGMLLLLALILWLNGLTHTSAAGLDQWGLVTAFPLSWYLSLGLTLGVLVSGLLKRRALRDGWMAAYVALLVLILYGSAAFVEDAPRLPWVYKHIAVTRYLELHGSVNPYIDIYQRWPGFFAWTAQLAQLIGIEDPVRWAGLAEPLFALFDVLLVLAITRALSADRRWSWTATVLFTSTNWVAQNYFAPQALGYTLSLLIGLLALTALRGEPGRLGRWLEARVSRVLGGRQGAARFDPAAARFPGGGGLATHRRWVIVALLTAFAVVVASHQLTPYLILLALVPLFVLGYFRPKSVPVAMVVITIAYLIPNLPYIQEHFGLFSGFDPVANAVYSAVDRSTLLPGAVWQARGTQLISAIVYVVAAVGLVRRVRAGGVRSALMVAWLMAAPVLVLGGQSYGGEGRLRVYLFSLPWAVMAASWTFWPSERAPNVRIQVGIAAVLTTLTALFVLSYFQPEADYRVPRSDIEAAQWMDQGLVKGDVILPTAPTFPLLVGPHYDAAGLNGALSDYKRYYPQRFTPDDVLEVAESLSTPDKPYRVFLIFSDNEYRYDQEHGLYTQGELAALEAQIGQVNGIQRVYDSGTTRIYRLK